MSTSSGSIYRYEPSANTISSPSTNTKNADILSSYTSTSSASPHTTYDLEYSEYTGTNGLDHPSPSLVDADPHVLQAMGLTLDDASINEFTRIFQNKYTRERLEADRQLSHSHRSRRHDDHYDRYDDFDDYQPPHRSARSGSPRRHERNYSDDPRNDDYYPLHHNSRNSRGRSRHDYDYYDDEYDDHNDNYDETEYNRRKRNKSRKAYNDPFGPPTSFQLQPQELVADLDTEIPEPVRKEAERFAQVYNKGKGELPKLSKPHITDDVFEHPERYFPHPDLLPEEERNDPRKQAEHARIIEDTNTINDNIFAVVGSMKNLLDRQTLLTLLSTDKTSPTSGTPSDYATMTTTQEESDAFQGIFPEPTKDNPYGLLGDRHDREFMEEIIKYAEDRTEFDLLQQYIIDKRIDLTKLNPHDVFQLDQDIPDLHRLAEKYDYSQYEHLLDPTYGKSVPDENIDPHHETDVYDDIIKFVKQRRKEALPDLYGSESMRAYEADEPRYQWIDGQDAPVVLPPRRKLLQNLIDEDILGEDPDPEDPLNKAKTAIEEQNKGLSQDQSDRLLSLLERQREEMTRALRETMVHDADVMARIDDIEEKYLERKKWTDRIGEIRRGESSGYSRAVQQFAPNMEEMEQKIKKMIGDDIPGFNENTPKKNRTYGDLINDLQAYGAGGTRSDGSDVEKLPNFNFPIDTNLMKEITGGIDPSEINLDELDSNSLKYLLETHPDFQLEQKKMRKPGFRESSPKRGEDARREIMERVDKRGAVMGDHAIMDSLNLMQLLSELTDDDDKASQGSHFQERLKGLREESKRDTELPNRGQMNSKQSQDANFGAISSPITDIMRHPRNRR